MSYTHSNTNDNILMKKNVMGHLRNCDEEFDEVYNI